MRIDAHSVAVVTGGASGLGAAVAASLARAGASVVIFDLDEAGGAAVAERIDGLFQRVDVADAESVRAGFVAARAAFGIESITVNCAGIVPAAKTVSRGTAHDAGLFQQVLAVNLLGTFNVGSQSAAGMVQRSLRRGGQVGKGDQADQGDDAGTADEERGVIVNTSSVAAMDGQVGQIAYAASKGGVSAMTLPMARDLADKAIRVVAIAPGIFATPMVEAFAQPVRDELAARIPHPARLGDPSEFAALVEHIVGNPYLNGEVIRLDGAVRMAPR